jgi:hypothetical protein
MNYRQLKVPNLSISGVSNLCLVYVRSVFGIAAKYAYAWLAWQNTTAKHQNRDLPDVCVALWFSYTATIDGIRRNWGHVAVWVPGKGIYSTTRTGVKLFAGIADVERHIGCSYVGWSEDINGVSVAERMPEDQEPGHSPFEMPPIGSLFQLLPNKNSVMVRTTYKPGTPNKAGEIRVPAGDLSYTYTARDYDTKYPGRVIIQSASGGGRVGIALFYLSGARVDNWRQL